MVTQERKPRLTWLVAALVVLVLAALGIPGRMLTQWAYAVERGKLRAGTEELAAVSQDLARIQEVSRAFRLVAKVARPGVVHIRVPGDEQAHQEVVSLTRERAELREQLERATRQVTEDVAGQLSAADIIELLVRLREIGDEIEALSRRLISGSGSGIILDDQGHILTNNHVVEDRSEIRVTLPDDREYEAVLIGNDPKTDLAVVKINAPDLHPLEFGDSDRMEVGDWVIAVGSPFELSQSVTHGIISATGRDSVDVLLSRGVLYQNFLQTDAAINPGNSGGPLLNLRGEVIGVNTAIATNGDGFNAGIAFTIPSNMAMKIAEQLRQTGEVVRGWLGITMGELTAADREVLGLEDRWGVLVASITEQAPADRDGLRLEDVILKVNDRPVASMAQLRGLIADIFPGDSARLGLLRDGEPIELVVKLGRRPADSELSATLEHLREAREFRELGLRARTLLPSSARLYGYRERDRGVLVWETIDDAVEPPIRPEEELIVACNGRPVVTAADLARILKATDQEPTVRLELLDRSNERRTVELQRR
jgi:serine protease Do